MPAKKTISTEAKRARRRRKTARAIGTDDAPRAFKQAFDKVVRPKTAAPSAAPAKSSKKKPRGR